MKAPEDWRTPKRFRSYEHLLNHLSMHVRQPPLDAVVVKAKALVIEAQEVEYRGVEIVNRGLVVQRLVAELVRGAVAESTFHPGAGQPHGETLWVMVAATGVLLKRRHPAEFSDKRDQRGGE